MEVVPASRPDETLTYVFKDPEEYVGLDQRMLTMGLLDAIDPSVLDERHASVVIEVQRRARVAARMTGS